MKKIEIFGLWLCLLGIFLLVFGAADNAGGAALLAIVSFAVGSILMLLSLWFRRKDK